MKGFKMTNEVRTHLEEQLKTLLENYDNTTPLEIARILSILAGTAQRATEGANEQYIAGGK